MAGAKVGDGSSPLSLSHASIRRLRGCRLPDAILHGKRSLRPRSRAVQRVAAAGFRVRLFSSLGLVVAPPACEPGQDTSAIHLRVLTTWLKGCHRFWRCVDLKPRVSPLNSQVAFCSQFSGAVFSAADLWKFFTSLAATPCPSRSRRSLCPAFRRLSFG